jgi:murein DD-endopeptidase MepM/ murein hydrolase activator NlpD
VTRIVVTPKSKILRRCAMPTVGIALTALFSAAAVAAPVKLDGPTVQGGLVVGYAEPGSRVTQDGKEIEVAPDGRFLLGFAYDAAPASEIDIESTDGESVTIPITVASRQFATEKIDHLPPEQVTPDAEAMKRIAAEREEVTAVQTKPTATPLFTRPFIWSATGIISGTYGSARILNGEPRAPHMGVDVAAPEGTPVVAPTEGRVVFVADLFFTGNTVILDHGLGLTSLYAHLAHVDVKVGDHVRQGDVIGALGATGRATAPNLHWGVHLNGVGLDPALLAGPMPSASSRN